MESIWSSTAQMPRFSSLSGDARTEVLIIGGGITGLLCAQCLASAGVECMVVEANTIAGGITQNTTAKITAQHGLIYHRLLSRFGRETARLYLDANLEALDAYRELLRDVDCDCSSQDSYIYSRGNRAKLEAEAAALQALGYPATVAETLPLPFPTAGAVRFPDQLQFHPLKFLSAISKKLTIFEHTPVRSVKNTTAVTDFGQITAQRIIVATHFPFLNTHGSYFLKLYQQRSYVLSLDSIDTFPGMYLDEQENGLSFRCHAGQVLLGGGGHRTGKSGGNWQELEAFARRYYPNAKITHRWATQDCMSLDGIPYIGRYSARTPNLYVATGFNKWGMTSAMVAARLLTDLIAGTGSPYAPVFSPSRSILHPQLAANAWETTRSLLTPTTRRCPHLGCALKWNPQEHTWDCPCHGSRFARDGHLLDNPATGDWKGAPEQTP